MGLYGFRELDDARVAYQMVVERRARIQNTHGAIDNEWDDVGGGASAVAITTIVIPARVDKTPGGPVDCVIQESIDGADFVEGETVEVYSWVKTDSPDPAEEPNGELYIYISQDQFGTWWYHAIDCSEADPPYVGIPSGGTILPDSADVIYVTD